MIALNTPITIPILRQIVVQGWGWWRDELLNALPARIRDRISPRGSEFLIDLTNNEAIVSQTQNGVAALVLHIPLGADRSGDHLDQAKRLFEKATFPKARIRLSPTMVLHRELELPRSTDSQLRKIVGLDLDRQTPFTSENAVFDLLVRETNNQTGRVRVEVVVIKKETIDAIMTLCRDLGVKADSITVGAASEFNLLRFSHSMKDAPAFNRPWLIATAGIVLLVVVNISLFYHRLDTRLDGLNRALVQARRDAQQTEKLRAQLERNLSAGQLLSQANATLSPLDVMKELTEILPDDVWIFQLIIDSGSIQIAGMAPSASDMIERLDKSARFTNPKLKAAVTRTDKPSIDRFEITADFRPTLAK